MDAIKSPRKSGNPSGRCSARQKKDKSFNLLELPGFQEAAGWNDAGFWVRFELQSVGMKLD